jgi:hypothetical protein
MWHKKRPFFEMLEAAQVLKKYGIPCPFSEMKTVFLKNG